MFHHLSLQGAALVRPLERLGQRLVEVLDECQYPLAQLLHRLEAASLEQSAHQDTQPQLDLVEIGKIYL